MNLTKNLAVFVTGALALVFLSGCALTKDYVTIKYVPQTNSVLVAGADKVAVTVRITDLRSVRDKVSAKKNGYGMEMAPIIATEDVNETVKKAIQVELKNRGFRVSEGDIDMLVQLTKFYSDFKVGFWAGDAVAEVMLSVQIKKADGNIIYSQSFIGEGTKPNIQLASGSNAQAALETALQNAVTRIFGDPLFLDGLVRGSKTDAVTAPSAQAAAAP